MQKKKKELFIPPADIVLSQRARFLNEEIFDMYRIYLCTCPTCGAILSTDESDLEPYCKGCKKTYRSDECGDLFY